MTITFKENLNEKEMLFIKYLVKKDLEKEHYKAELEKLYLQLKRINEKNIVDISPYPDYKSAEAHLFLVEDSGKTIGFTVIIFREFNKDEQFCEIYMLSLKDCYKGNGYGKKIIQKIENEFGKDSITLARCLPPSLGMKKLLTEIGYKSCSKGDNSTTESFIKYTFT